MKLLMLSGLLGMAVTSTTSVRAGSMTGHQEAPASTVMESSVAVPPASTRYGPFGLLDHSSQYGLGVLPEPFLVDDSDLEVNELRLDLFDTRTGAQHTDLFKAELESGL